MNKKYFLTTTLCLVLGLGLSWGQEILSPNKAIKLIVNLSSDGTPHYEVFFNEKAVINPSSLGIELTKEPSLLSGFKLKDTTTSSFDDTWNPVWGRRIRN